MHNFLYKMDSKGKIRIWHVEVDGCTYTQVYGLAVGKKVRASTTITEGKNIGKSNETTPEQQCLAEAKALEIKKRDRNGYTQHIPTDKPFMPMLAQKYNVPGPDISILKDGKKIVYPCFMQPKLDGVRSMANREYMMSRKRTPQLSVPHIQAHLKKHLHAIHETLDGELYLHGEDIDFETLTGFIRRDKPSVETSVVEYHIYDVFMDDKNYVERRDWLMKNIPNTFPFVLVPSYVVNNHQEVVVLLEQFLEQGYEGGMLRNFEGGYKINARSKDLQKVKVFDEDEFPIIGAKCSDKGNNKGECTFICQLPNGNTVDVTPKGKHEARCKHWQNYMAGKYKGKALTVEYFGKTNSTPWSLRFPVGKTIRDYE